MTRMDRLSCGVLAAAALIALLVLVAPALPQWGARHLAHLDRPHLQLPPGRVVEQTYVFETDRLDTFILWVDPTHPFPNLGTLRLTIETGKASREAIKSLRDIPPSGTAVFSFPSPLRAHKGAPGIARVVLEGTREPVWLTYQLDSSKYPEGRLRVNGRERPGDLAFQIRYQRPALGSVGLHRVFAAAILLAGGMVTRLFRRRQGPTTVWALRRADVVHAATLGLLVTVFYGAFLLRPGLWVGAGDFSKDAAYLASAADAVRGGVWPTWSHRTCGGMALLGNPEGNTVSLGTLFALALPPDRALLLLLIVEGGLSAAGTFLLARTLGLGAHGSVAASVIASLSSAYAYRIVEGLTPVGGAVAFLPWVFLFLEHAIRNGRNRGPAVFLSGTALAAMLLRGDVHVVVGAALAVVVWVFLRALQRRSLATLTVLLGVGASAFLWSSVKLLPYLEQPSLIQSALPPYVVPLARFRLLDDALLRIHDRGDVAVRPLHDRRVEQWGNFGGYVGTIALLFGGIGMLTKHPARLPVLGSAAVAFAVSEGMLFETVLRHNEVLGSLLRVPTRVLSVFVLFLGIGAGMGLERILRDARGWGRRAVTVGFLLFLTVDLGWAAGRVLLANTDWSVVPPRLAPSGPTLALHQNVSPDHERHATKLVRAGFLLPRICGDQNNPPTFIRELSSDQPLASVPSEIRPNRIFLQGPAGPADIRVNERFTSSWSAADATVLEDVRGGLQVVTPSGQARTVELQYRSGTVRAQQALLTLLVVGLVLAGIQIWRREGTLPL